MAQDTVPLKKEGGMMSGGMVVGGTTVARQLAQQSRAIGLSHSPRLRIALHIFGSRHTPA